jgi:hypothetical protein
LAKSKLKPAAAGDRSGELPGSGSDPAVNDPGMRAATVSRRAPAVNDPEARDPARREAREARIRERAYRRAEACGFAPGRELEDWLAAEDELLDDDATGAPR